MQSNVIANPPSLVFLLGKLLLLARRPAAPPPAGGLAVGVPGAASLLGPLAPVALQCAPVLDEPPADAVAPSMSPPNGRVNVDAFLRTIYPALRSANQAVGQGVRVTLLVRAGARTDCSLIVHADHVATASPRNATPMFPWGMPAVGGRRHLSWLYESQRVPDIGVFPTAPLPPGP